MILYFTYESRGALKSLTLFITVKTITKLNHVVVLQRTTDMYQKLLRTPCTLRLTKSLVTATFKVPVAVARRSRRRGFL